MGLYASASSPPLVRQGERDRKNTCVCRCLCSVQWKVKLPSTFSLQGRQHTSYLLPTLHPARACAQVVRPRRHRESKTGRGTPRNPGSENRARSDDRPVLEAVGIENRYDFDMLYIYIYVRVIVPVSTPIFSVRISVGYRYRCPRFDAFISLFQAAEHPLGAVFHFLEHRPYIQRAMFL